jgi:hypothetical protein
MENPVLIFSVQLEKIDAAAKTLRFRFAPTDQLVQVHYEVVQGMELTWGTCPGD